jgi:hypothetical protein
MGSLVDGFVDYTSASDYLNELGQVRHIRSTNTIASQRAVQKRLIITDIFILK